MTDAPDRADLRVHVIPGLPPSRVLGSRTGGRIPEPLDADSTRFYHRGRYALWHALEALGLEQGASVAFPAFHCGAELVPFARRGIGLRYYRVDRALCADLDSLANTLDGVAAVFVTHSLGFPQEIEAIVALCRERGLPLIEDCAHALTGRVGGRPLGTFGDVSIFSMHKFLPMPDGAALCVNAPALRMPDAPRPAPRAHAIGAAAFEIGRHLKEAGGGVGAATRAFARLRRGARRRAAPGSTQPLFFAERVDWGMSRLSGRLLAETVPEVLTSARRANYQLLLERLEPTEAVRPLLPALREGVCPLMFPVLASEPDALVARLRRAGIQSDPYWSFFAPDFPEADFPDEAYLKRHVIALPVHQALDREALESIAAAVRG